ncbi:MAG: PIN/TRAM domain-containing protein, partial [Vulcanococcus sp.]
IVAQAVIDELQALADSANAEKRGKGRRGLKLLSALREAYGRRLVVNTTRYEGNGVDDKLLKLSADTGGTLLTADYNLAKVAEVQDLKVMNLSELVIALRPEVQPGDELQLKIVRDGKESHQGVGYLEDGTMVVVDGAHGRSGERLAVVVTGALQTPTGRMVFGRLEGHEPAEVIAVPGSPAPASPNSPARGNGDRGGKRKSAPKRGGRGDQDPAGPR